MNRKSLFLSVAGLIILAFGMATFIYKNHSASQQEASGGQNQDVVERQGAPVKGPADARVTIVEFLDPACETCADFYPFVSRLISQHPGKVKLMVRYAPFHTGSDQVVRILEAAHKQGKFWPALELLFKNQRRWTSNHVAQPMRAQGILKGIPLDHEQLMADMNKPDVASAIQQDVADLGTLGVKATPGFFVNGRPLTDFGYQQLAQMVKDAVDEAY